MASIEKRGKNSFRLIVEAGYDANGKRIKRSKTVKVKTKREAEIELAKFITEVETGEYIAPEKMTFKQFSETEWLTKHAEKELSATTLKKYIGQLNTHIFPAFGHKQLNDIKTLHLVSFITDLQKPGARKDGKEGSLSGATILDIHKILKSVFSKATDWRVIPKNPMDGVKRPTVEKRKPKYYEADEAQQVIEALYTEPVGWRLYFLAAMMGGFRRGELTGLEWPDVYFEDNTFTIRQSISLTRNGQALVKDPKTEESFGTVDMPEWYMKELKAYYTQWKKDKLQAGDAWQGGGRQYVFHSGLGKPYYFTVPTQRWSKFLKKHGLKYVNLHGLRHTAGTLLIETGIAEGVDPELSLKAVQERLRHGDLATTADIYGHITKKASKALANKLDKFAPKNSVPNSSPTSK